MIKKTYTLVFFMSFNIYQIFKKNGILHIKIDKIYNKAIAMMRRKSPRSENIYLIENHCQANISK